jgi:AcrR family transcriptional regulator
MHDISAEAGISVGLIYRYFKNKEEVIAALAAEHKKDIADLIERAGQAPTLLEAMEILFTSHCCEHSPQIISAFVVDLFAEASRNPRVAKVVRNVSKTKADGVADLIARSPEGRRLAPWLDPHEIAEMIFALHDGAMMRSVFPSSGSSIARQRERQLNVACTLCHFSVELPMQTVTTKPPLTSVDSLFRPTNPDLQPRPVKRARSSSLSSQESFSWLLCL